MKWKYFKNLRSVLGLVIVMLLATLLLIISVGSEQKAYAMESDVNAEAYWKTVRLQLHVQIVRLTQIEPTVERQDLPRLYALRETAKRTLQSVEQNQLHTETIRALQTLLNRFRYSFAFFRSIQTQETTRLLDDVTRLNEDFSKQFGLDLPMNVQVASIFIEMKANLDQIVNYPVPDALKLKIYLLRVPLGRLIAMASAGDYPGVFQPAREISDHITGLYVDLDALSGSKAVFEAGLAIRGLNELYLDLNR